MTLYLLARASLFHLIMINMVKIFQDSETVSASLIMIKSDDLVSAMETLYTSAREDAMKQIEDNSISTNGIAMVSAKEAKTMLKKSSNTLWKWAKRGYLVPVKVGGTLMYHLADIHKIMGGK